MTGAPPNEGAGRPRRALLEESIAVFAVTFVACAAVGIAGRFVPFVQENVLAFVAAVFLYTPLYILGRRREDPAAFGITAARPARQLAAAGLAMLVVFPPFLLGYHLYHGAWLGQRPVFSLGMLARWSPDPDGPPEHLATSDGIHLWAVGRRVALYAGKRAEGPPPTLRLTADAPCDAAYGPVSDRRCESPEILCTPAPERGCLFDAPRWRALAVRAETETELRLGRFEERTKTPLDLAKGWSWWWLFVLLQIGLVALPEEVLYRGYLQSRLNAVWEPRWRLLGATIGPALFVTSGLFAVGHLAIEPGPFRLLVFFPSLLFGWLRERTGSVGAGIVFHAACNALLRGVSSFYYS